MTKIRHVQELGKSPFTGVRESVWFLGAEGPVLKFLLVQPFQKKILFSPTLYLFY
jgi:hypothetical protein